VGLNLKTSVAWNGRREVILRGEKHVDLPADRYKEAFCCGCLESWWSLVVAHL